MTKGAAVAIHKQANRNMNAKHGKEDPWRIQGHDEGKQVPSADSGMPLGNERADPASRCGIRWPSVTVVDVNSADDIMRRRFDQGQGGESGACDAERELLQAHLCKHDAPRLQADRCRIILLAPKGLQARRACRTIVGPAGLFT